MFYRVFYNDLLHRIIRQLIIQFFLLGVNINKLTNKVVNIYTHYKKKLKKLIYELQKNKIILYYIMFRYSADYYNNRSYWQKIDDFVAGAFDWAMGGIKSENNARKSIKNGIMCYPQIALKKSNRLSPVVATKLPNECIVFDIEYLPDELNKLWSELENIDAFLNLMEERNVEVILLRDFTLLRI